MGRGVPVIGPRHLTLPRGASMAYRDSRRFPAAAPVMLLHGVGMTADLNWGAAYADLCRHFRVVAPDLPGHGRGIRPWPTFSIEECADHIVALADSLGIEQVHRMRLFDGKPGRPADLAAASGPDQWACSRCHVPQLPGIPDRTDDLVAFTGLRCRRQSNPFLRSLRADALGPAT